MNLCGCGKPGNHGGMCSVRWAARKANNGPSGLKAKAAEADGPISEEAIARRLFGDMADDILMLRKRGHTVARFKDGFRVDRDVWSDDRVRAMARLLRSAKKSQAGPTTVRNGGGSGALSVENAREGRNGGANGRGSPSNQGPPAVADAPDITARMSQLEQRVEFLFAVVADAIQGKRETLIEQASGLAKLAAELRDAA